MPYARESPARLRSRWAAFTLVELLVVIAVLVLLISLLLPTISNAVEWSRIANCGSILSNIGAAAPVRHREPRQDDALLVGGALFYSLLPYGVDGNGNPYDIRYGTWYDYHNLLAPYLGLGNCMPVEVPTTDPRFWPQWCTSYDVVRSAYPQFQCPGGLGVSSPYGPIMDMGNTGPHGSFYMQNASWSSQPINVNWPQYSANFSLFTDTSQGILFFELWACNGDSPDLDGTASRIRRITSSVPRAPWESDATSSTPTST